VTDTIEVSLRGLPEWLIRDYLRDLGAGGDDGASTMSAPGWSVTWSRRTATIEGSPALALTQFDLVFTGDPPLVRDAHDRFMRKAQRGGG
jgi:hypothetical protein